MTSTLDSARVSTAFWAMRSASSLVDDGSLTPAFTTTSLSVDVGVGVGVRSLMIWSFGRW